MAPGELYSDDVREHLRHIVASAGFRNAGSIRRLLEFTVEKVLAGESSEIKEYTLGLDVFGRKESFDPRTDAIVRVQARKLRERLLAYYESEGAREAFRIEYPKGSYIPQIAAPQPSGAYQLYLKGRHFWNQRTEHGLRRAIECYQAAVEDEPRFARAWAAMAETYQLTAAHSLDAPDSCLQMARRAAETALSLDPGLAAAHSAMASIHITCDRNPAAAQLEWERALEIDPNYAPAWHVLALFGYALGGLGSLEDAVAALRQAERLEPLSPAIACDFGFILYWGRRYAEAIEACHRALDLHPSFCRTYVPLARAHALLGNYEAAIRICLEGQPQFRGLAFLGWLLATLGYCYGRTGRMAEAENVIEELRRTGREHYVSAYDIATVHVGTGDRDRTMESLRAAVQERAFWLIALPIEPLFDSMRGEKEFEQLSKDYSPRPSI